MVTGADVDYAALTHALLSHLKGTDGFAVNFRHRVTGLEHLPDGRWRVQVKDLDSGQRQSVNTKFVFLGAGGGPLPLLQKSGIPEGRGHGGLPVPRPRLRTEKPLLA